MDERFWGYHAILDAAGCNHNAITSYDNIYAFSKQLVKDIDMVAFGEPQIVNFGADEKNGFTLVQLIETSNICAHFVNAYDHMYLDVFSCKPFDERVVEDLVVKFFGAKTIRRAFIKRQAMLDIEKVAEPNE